MHFQDFVHWPGCAASSAIPRRASFDCYGAQKNTLRHLRSLFDSGWYDRKSRRVRDLSCGDTRVYLEFEVRRVQCRQLRRGEARAAGFPGRQPVLHQALCLLCRPALPRRRRSRTSPRNCTWTGTPSRSWTSSTCGSSWPGRHAGAAGVIGIDEISIRKGHTYRIVVSDLDAAAADLVRREGPLRGEHGRVLRLAGREEEPAASGWR